MLRAVEQLWVIPQQHTVRTAAAAAMGCSASIYQLVQVAHRVLQHAEERHLTSTLLPHDEYRALCMFQELEAEQVASVLLAR